MLSQGLIQSHQQKPGWGLVIGLGVAATFVVGLLLVAKLENGSALALSVSWLLDGAANPSDSMRAAFTSFSS